MTEAVTPDIPNRALFKAAEVCDLVKVQPYVLRTWEAEFPELGVARAEGGPRVYRRADVEQVFRIKHLLLVEGLTLAGARRKLQEQSAPVEPETPIAEELIAPYARERLVQVKRGLQSILELLAGRASAEFQLTAPIAAPEAGERRSRTAASVGPSAAADDDPGHVEASPVAAAPAVEPKARGRGAATGSGARRKR